MDRFREFRKNRYVANVNFVELINITAGQTAISLHSEDVLRYGAKGIAPDEERVMNLFRHVTAVKGIERIGASHISLASVYHEPELLNAISELCYSVLDRDWMGAQTGIETGSGRLIAKHMCGKAAYFVSLRNIWRMRCKSM